MQRNIKIALLIVLLIGVVICMFIFINKNRIRTFSLEEYKESIELFPSDEVLGETLTAKNAVEKAEILWLGKYGESVKKDKPYKIYYDKISETWLIKGTLPFYMRGGVPYVIIQKSDGKVLAVWHDK